MNQQEHQRSGTMQLSSLAIVRSRVKWKGSAVNKKPATQPDLRGDLWTRGGTFKLTENGFKHFVHWWYEWDGMRHIGGDWCRSRVNQIFENEDERWEPLFCQNSWHGGHFFRTWCWETIGRSGRANDKSEWWRWSSPFWVNKWHLAFDTAARSIGNKHGTPARRSAFPTPLLSDAILLRRWNSLPPNWFTWSDVTVTRARKSNE